jgi:hypothetical protein
MIPETRSIVVKDRRGGGSETVEVRRSGFWSALLAGNVVLWLALAALVALGRTWTWRSALGLAGLLVFTWALTRSMVLLRERPALLWAVFPVAVGYILAVIAAFSLLYQSAGLIGPDGLSREWLDCFYFSAITFTTVGYGDFRPVPEARPIALIEALYGYIGLGLFLGVVVAVATSSLRPSAPREPGPGEPPAPSPPGPSP